MYNTRPAYCGRAAKNPPPANHIGAQRESMNKRYVLFGASSNFLKLIFVVPTVQQYSSKVQRTTAKYATIQQVQWLSEQQVL